MKLRDLYKVNSRKSLLISILVHLVILTLLATATLQLTTPDGMVLDDEIEMGLAGGGEPTPVDVAPEAPRGSPEPEEVSVPEPQPEKAVVEAPTPTEPAEVEEQHVAQPAPAPTPKPKSWIPVEETDVDDSAGGTASSDDQETQVAQNEGQTGSPEGETSDSQGSGGGTGGGPVKSAAELKALPGNPKFYPYLARVQRIEGTSIVRFTLNEDGGVSKVWLHRSSGSKILDNAALEAVAQWKFESGSSEVYEQKMVYVLKGPAEMIPHRPKQ